MNTAVIFEIMQLVVSLGHSHLESDGGEVEETLLDIIKTAVEAYEKHTGEPINPYLITSEDPV